MKSTLLSAALLLGACAGSTVYEQSRSQLRLGQEVRAYRTLDAERQRLLDAGLPVPAELERAWRDARITYLVERGRYYIFSELDDEALASLAGALALAPDHAEAKALRERAIEKKATRYVAAGRELLAERRLAEALSAFLEAERALPTSADALAGQAEVRAEFDKLTKQAQAQFLEAVRKLPEFRYVEVRWHSSNALVNDPARDDARDVRQRAQREIAQATLARGRAYQGQDQFGAALIEFKAAKDIDDDLPGIDEAIAEMEQELAASKLAEEAQMHMRRRDFDAAGASLEQAFEMTKMLRGQISELMIENRRMRAEDRYERARDFEIQGMKQEALAAFVALSAEWPEGLFDEKERIEGLQADIANARMEWELAVAAEEAGKPDEALEHYLASERFYSRLHDAKARIARLRARQGPESGGQGGQSGQSGQGGG